MVMRDWKADIKTQCLDIRTDEVLEGLKDMYSKKILHSIDDLYWLNKYPDVKRMELEKSELSDEEIEEELQSEINHCQWKLDKLNDAALLVSKEQELRLEARGMKL